jgi:hypothetical protein
MFIPYKFALHKTFSAKSSHLQMIDPTPEFLAAQLLYVQVPIVAGSVQTDKQHAHRLYSSTKLITQYCNNQAATFIDLLSSIMVFPTLSYLKMNPELLSFPYNLNSGSYFLQCFHCKSRT